METGFEKVILYAWVGEDELGSGEIGIKQGLVPAGMIPLVSINKEKLSADYIKEMLQQQSSVYGKAIKLCKFVYSGEVITLTP